MGSTAICGKYILILHQITGIENDSCYIDKEKVEGKHFATGNEAAFARLGVTVRFC